MHKQSKKQDIELAALMFLVGLLLFFYPVVTQVSSYQADEEKNHLRSIRTNPLLWYWISPKRSRR